MKTSTKIALPSVACVLLVALGGCGQKYADDRGRGDAGVSKYDDGKWFVINAPDGFGNLASRCNPIEPGTRIYIVTHYKTDVQPLVKDDPSCGPKQAQ